MGKYLGYLLVGFMFAVFVWFYPIVVIKHSLWDKYEYMWVTIALVELAIVWVFASIIVNEICAEENKSK